MPQIPAAIPTQAFELIRNRIAEILVDELPEQATLSGDTQINATVYVERFVPFDHTELPALNVSLGRDVYSEQTQRSTDGEHTYNIDVHCSAKSTPSVRGDSLAVFRLQKLLGVCRGVLEDSRYKTLGFAPPFIESRKVTAIDYAQPTEGDSTSSVMGRITFVVRAPDRNGVVTPELIAGYDTQVKLGLTEKGYIFSGDNIPVPPVFGAEISVNDTFFVDALAGDEIDIPVLNSEGDAVGNVSAGVNVIVPDATYTLIDTDVPPNQLDSGSIPSGGLDAIVAPPATLSVNTTQVATIPAGGSDSITVQDTAATPIGSLVSGNWLIPNRALSLNGTDVDTFRAAIDVDLTVTLDSAATTPTYDQGTKTINVVSPPVTFPITAYPFKTGDVTSNTPNDDGAGQWGRDRLTLNFTNPLGTNARFVRVGDIVYDFGQGDPNTRTFLAIDAVDITTSRTFNNHCAYGVTKVKAGITNWHMITVSEGFNLLNWGQAIMMNYAPFNFNLGPFFWLSTAYFPNNNTTAWILLTASTDPIQTRLKSNSFPSMFATYVTFP
jgi:hypothetical protein